MRDIIEAIKEIATDVAHAFRHRHWTYRDDNGHWHCTLCNVDLSELKVYKKV